MKNDIKSWQEKLKGIPTEDRIKSIRQAMEKNSDGKYSSEQLNKDLLIIRGKKC